MKITIQQCEDKIEEKLFIKFKTLTICILQLDNGFYVVGKSAPVDENEYDDEAGKKYAYRDAISKVLELEAYVTREEKLLLGTPLVVLAELSPMDICGF